MMFIVVQFCPLTRPGSLPSHPNVTVDVTSVCVGVKYHKLLFFQGSRLCF